MAAFPGFEHELPPSPSDGRLLIATHRRPPDLPDSSVPSPKILARGMSAMMFSQNVGSAPHPLMCAAMPKGNATNSDESGWMTMAMTPARSECSSQLCWGSLGGGPKTGPEVRGWPAAEICLKEFRRACRHTAVSNDRACLAHTFCFEAFHHIFAVCLLCGFAWGLSGGRSEIHFSQPLAASLAGTRTRAAGSSGRGFNPAPPTSGRRPLPLGRSEGGCRMHRARGP